MGRPAGAPGAPPAARAGRNRLGARPTARMAGSAGQALRGYRCYLGTFQRDPMRTALFPGPFDPFHNGHLEIVETASRVFERIVIAPGPNRQKARPFFTIDERRPMLAAS